MTGSFQEVGLHCIQPRNIQAYGWRSLPTTAGNSREVLRKTASFKKVFGNKWLSNPLLFSPNRLYLNSTLFI